MYKVVPETRKTQPLVSSSTTMSTDIDLATSSRPHVDYGNSHAAHGTSDASDSESDGVTSRARCSTRFAQKGLHAKNGKAKIRPALERLCKKYVRIVECQRPSF
jgi:hypothetical protein